MKAFMISFDPLTTNASAVHSLIVNMAAINEWWHYLSGTYIVTSEKNMQEIRDQITAAWPGGNFLVTELHGITDGSMPKDSWDWLNTRVPFN